MKFLSLYFMFSRGLCCKTAKTARECSMSSRGGYGRWPAIHLCSEGQTIPWKSTGRCLVSPGGRMGAPEQSAVEAAMAFRMPRRRFPCQWAWWPSGLPLVGCDVPAWRLNWRTSRVQQEHDGEPLGPGGGASRQRGAVVPGLRSTLGRCPSNCKPSKSPALCSWRGPHVIAIVGEVVLFAIVAGPASTAAPSCPATAATAPSATTPPHLSSLPLARPHSKPSSL